MPYAFSSNMRKVELRAFCLKHSVFQDTSNAQQSDCLKSTVVDGDSSVAELLPVTVAVNRFPKIKLSCRSRNKSMELQGEVIKSEISSKPDSLGESGNSKLTKDMEMPRVAERDSGGDVNPPSSTNPVSILKKLIDQGKVNARHVASEMGISFDLFALILADEDASVSSDLQLKVVKWLRGSAHFATSTQCLKFKNNASLPTGSKAASNDGPDAMMETNLVDPITVSMKTLPATRRTKNNTKDSKDDQLPVSFGEKAQQNGNRLGVNDCSESLFVSDDLLQDGTCNGSLSQKQNHIHKEPEEIMEKVAVFLQIPAETLDLAVANPPEGRLPTNEGKHLLAGNSAAMLKNMPETQQESQPLVEALSSFGITKSKVYEADATDGNNCVKARGGRGGHAPCPGVQSMPDVSNAACTQNVTKRDNLDDEDKKREILQHSPEDEVEGEILYFQSRLLDNAVASKRLCGLGIWLSYLTVFFQCEPAENLILRVVTNLPHELDALRKQRWDAVTAHQYICNLREAKKQGRKERRHREAQAVLAAATAAAAASSRNSSLRKDAHDESLVKVNTVSGRSPRAKETLSRLAFPKSELSEVFQLSSDISKDQLRSCDICKRTETISPRNLSANAQERSSFVIRCGLCGGTTGAFRKTIDGIWVHAFCAEWILESTFRRGQADPVEGMEAVAGERDLLVCCICRRKLGVCLKCNYGNCQSAFHPTCAKDSGFYMTVKRVGGRSQHKAYCEKHSLEQREKAEAQHHGVEELQSIRQMRVELEKVRLLCERIIKREKLKEGPTPQDPFTHATYLWQLHTAATYAISNDGISAIDARQFTQYSALRELVLCSHDIMASKRDMVAFSILARSSFYAPDVSSESVTTSLRGHPDDNNSGSEALQRSDDTTVDSIVSGKRRATLPHMDTDRKIDDSSTSRWPLMQKPIERVSFSGKQLLLRPPTIASRNTLDDGGKRSKSRKHTETFRKELVMTSDQAMTYNMMLPKGYAYVPRACLPTEKPVTCNAESHEYEEDRMDREQKRMDERAGFPLIYEKFLLILYGLGIDHISGFPVNLTVQGIGKAELQMLLGVGEAAILFWGNLILRRWSSFLLIRVLLITGGSGFCYFWLLHKLHQEGLLCKEVRQHATALLAASLPNELFIVLANAFSSCIAACRETHLISVSCEEFLHQTFCGYLIMVERFECNLVWPSDIPNYSGYIWYNRQAQIKSAFQPIDHQLLSFSNLFLLAKRHNGMDGSLDRIRECAGDCWMLRSDSGHLIESWRKGGLYIIGQGDMSWMGQQLSWAWDRRSHCAGFSRASSLGNGSLANGEWEAIKGSSEDGRLVLRGGCSHSQANLRVFGRPVGFGSLPMLLASKRRKWKHYDRDPVEMAVSGGLIVVLGRRQSKLRKMGGDELSWNIVSVSSPSFWNMQWAGKRIKIPLPAKQFGMADR
ncbi:hypothetical protein ACLOJK_013832 [Asimina triloba]